MIWLYVFAFLLTRPGDQLAPCAVQISHCQQHRAPGRLLQGHLGGMRKAAHAAPGRLPFFCAVFLCALCRNVKYLSSDIIPLHRMV